MFSLVTLAAAFGLSVPLGIWIEKVMNQRPGWLSGFDAWISDHLKISLKEMNWKTYLFSVLLFSLVCFLLLWAVLVLDGLSWPVALNTAVSFITNTNWQSYDPTLQLSWPVQMLAITLANFLSAACGICVLFAMIRGIVQAGRCTVGSFWRDLVHAMVFVLIPLSVVFGAALTLGGVPMHPSQERLSALAEPVAADQNGQIIPGAVIEGEKVYADGELIEDAVIVDQQLLPDGMIASQEAIKMLGTNGGGLSAANSASPFENPSALTNGIENAAILLIPMALCFSLGEAFRRKKQGWALFAAMAILFLMALAAVWLSEQGAANLEGKEVRIGLDQSALWAVSTTAASSGSVNSAMNSLTPLSGMLCMILMQTGEVIFGGAGSGLYGMLAFVILAVFLAGLMVGRTPEFMGKKIEPFEMKWALILCLTVPVCILASSALACLFPMEGLDPGAHGFSQILYAFSSMGANNGSAFAGFDMNGNLLNLSGALIMALSRFIPMAGALAIAGSLGAKKKTAQSAGTLSTENGLFVFFLVLIVLLVGALSFFPALALGPLAEFF